MHCISLNLTGKRDMHEFHIVKSKSFNKMIIKLRKECFLNFNDALICHPSMITHDSITIVEFF